MKQIFYFLWLFASYVFGQSCNSQLTDETLTHPLTPSFQQLVVNNRFGSVSIDFNGPGSNIQFQISKSPSIQSQITQSNGVLTLQLELGSENQESSSPRIEINRFLIFFTFVFFYRNEGRIFSLLLGLLCTIYLPQTLSDGSCMANVQVVIPADFIVCTTVITDATGTRTIHEPRCSSSSFFYLLCI